MPPSFGRHDRISAVKPNPVHSLSRVHGAATLRIADVDAIVALIADDVRLTMPPLPLEYVGLEDARRFYAMVAARSGRRRLIQTKANGQPGGRVLLPRCGRGRVPRDQPDGGHAGRSPNLRPDAVRSERPAALRATPDPAF